MKHDKQQKGSDFEKIITEIAESAFFRYWCYPNPEWDNGDEICDLLIVFENKMIVIECKNYAFEGHEKEAAFSRYQKKVYGKGGRQLSGALRKLRLQGKVTLEHFDHLSSEEINFSQITEVHLLLLHKGENLEFENFTLDGGSEMIHVMTLDAFKNITNELDTISDFLGYINERERLFSQTGKSFFISDTEEDLMAIYLKNMRSFPERLFAKDSNHIFLEASGAWDDYLARPEVINKKNADQESYVIDEIIDKELLPPKDEAMFQFGRELARHDRFTRRTIAKSINEFVRTNHQLTVNNPGKIFTAKREADIDFGGTHYLFFYYNKYLPEDCIETVINALIVQTVQRSKGGIKNFF